MTNFSCMCITDDSLSGSKCLVAIQAMCFCYFDVLMDSFLFKVKEILEEILKGHSKKTSKVLLVAASDKKVQALSSSLKRGNCTVTDGSHDHSFTICSR